MRRRAWVPEEPPAAPADGHFDESWFVLKQREGVGGVARPDACSALPAAVVRSIGLWTHKGPLLDLAVLSALLFRYRVSLYGDSTWSEKVLEQAWVQEDPKLPELLRLQPGEFWISRQRVALDLRRRWRFADPNQIAFGDGVMPQKGVWKQFFENVRNAFKRLEAQGHVIRLRDVQKSKKAQATMGSIFTLDGTPTGLFASSMPDLAAPGALLMHREAVDQALAIRLREAADDAPVAAVDLVGAACVAFAAHEAAGGRASVKAFQEASPALAVESYRWSETTYEITSPRRSADFLGWSARQARGRPHDGSLHHGERHLLVGAWAVRHLASHAEQRANLPCIVPWVVLDFDRGDIDDAFDAAKRVVRELLRLGVQPQDIICAPTGGRGIHVHVPCGAFGTPLFRDSDSAKQVLGRIVEELVDEHVDTGVLGPTHLIRAVGSGYHRATSKRADTTPRFKQRVETTAFLTMSLPEIEAQTRRFVSTKLPDPRSVKPVDALIALASWHAVQRRITTTAPRSKKTASVAAVEAGVGAGERNRAAFLMATYYLDQLGMSDEEAEEALAAWNRLNHPPLGKREWTRVLRSAVRHIERKAAAR